MDCDEYFAYYGEPHPEDYDRWMPPGPDYPEQEYPEQEMPAEVAADILRAVRDKFSSPTVIHEATWKWCQQMPADIVAAIDVALGALKGAEEGDE
jgi:hypothetical protein